MSSVPAGKRSWKCPECGSEVLLSMTQLDPMACESCLAKMKSGSSTTGTSVAGIVAGPMATWQALPEMVKLTIAFAALIVGFGAGFIVGMQFASPILKSAAESAHSKSRPLADETPRTEETVHTDATEIRPAAPGPGYKWVSGRKHKDGTRGEGHWAKDPRYKGEEDSSKK